MKKLILIICIITLNFSCGGQKKATTATIDKDGNLAGIVTKSNFLVKPFNQWFNFNYNDYTPNIKTIEQLKPIVNSVKIKAFMGTWCGDSQEQTPVFYKILEAANFNFKNLEFVSVNHAKKSPNNLQKGHNIIRVPTFIFFEEGKEIGRIVEFPQETIEADMLKIISGKPYKHSYED